MLGTRQSCAEVCVREHGTKFVCFKLESRNIGACYTECSCLANCTSIFYTPAA
ncbi:hypothetical protein DPMN_132634 [Dreissena polymorpha]|uniref:Uncharacterized protein n=1 Tax=Dreissena polymorpha TaxID=45954 RepID=A0A9D4JA98_DREPO|nr:hypothetical protein DPMN_132634 [Dreissena polymorpha]